MLGKWFTTKRAAALRREIEGTADRMTGDMAAQGRPAELQAALGSPLPALVISNLLGVPDSDREGSPNGPTACST